MARKKFAERFLETALQKQGWMNRMRGDTEKKATGIFVLFG
jgi:hypothetical protein